MKLDITRKLHFELWDNETISEQVNKVSLNACFLLHSFLRKTPV